MQFAPDNKNLKWTGLQNLTDLSNVQINLQSLLLLSVAYNTQAANVKHKPLCNTQKYRVVRMSQRPY